MHRSIIPLAVGSLLLVSACDDDDNGVAGPGDEGVALELVAEGLTSPVALVEPPDGSGRLFVVDQIGEIRIIDSDGELLDEPFLSVEDRMVELMSSFDERGLLGLAFHPEYQDNGRFYVYYTAPPRLQDYNNTSRVSGFSVMAGNPDRADPGSEVVIIEEDQPQFNHEGGTLAFGPDGYLYISWGDGGGANDNQFGHVPDWYEFNEGGNGQDVEQNFLGSILRIDIDAGDPYFIPADNPFVGGPGLDEIYAYGFRNPYRFSFDMGGNNDLLVGDAGQELWEEVSIVENGGNYGWNVKEGTHCFDASQPEDPPSSCPDTDPEGDPLIDPVIEFRNSKIGDGGVGVVVVGGYVYRGSQLPDLEGQYIFGAWSTSFSIPDGVLLVADPESGPGLWDFEEIELTNTPAGDLGSFLMGFGQDADGEVYVLTSDAVGPSGQTGAVYRLVAGS